MISDMVVFLPVRIVSLSAAIANSLNSFSVKRMENVLFRFILVPVLYCTVEFLIYYIRTRYYYPLQFLAIINKVVAGEDGPEAL